MYINSVKKKSRPDVAKLFSEIDGVLYKFCKYCNANHEYTKEFWYIGSGSPNSSRCKKKTSDYGKMKRKDPEWLKKKQEYKKKWFQDKWNNDSEWREKKKANRVYDYKRQYELEKQKCKNNPTFAAHKKIRSSIYNALIRKKFKKSKRSEEILGCSIEFFRAYIEAQFEEGMNWDDMNGNWHLDHICPVNQAQNEEEMLLLNHWRNFRPVTAFENLSKSDKPTLEAVAACKKLLNRDWR